MVYKIKAKKNNTKKRNKKSIRRKLRRNKTKKNKKSTRRRKRGAGMSDYHEPSFKDRVRGLATYITPSSSSEYYDRASMRSDNRMYDTKFHMQSLYDDEISEITPKCDTPQQCRCTSDNQRVQDLINMLKNGGICTECEKQCPKMQKILEKYKGLSDIDLRSLPFTYFGYSRSRFPAYYKGYMTPSRINKLIQYKINKKIYNISDKNFEVPKKMYIGYDKYGNTLSRCRYMFRGDERNEILKKCNNIIDKINKLNKELDKKSGNTKKYILFQVDYDNDYDNDDYNDYDNYDGYKYKLFLVDKDDFTPTYRPEIIKIENELDI